MRPIGLKACGSGRWAESCPCWNLKPYLFSPSIVLRTSYSVLDSGGPSRRWTCSMFHVPYSSWFPWAFLKEQRDLGQSVWKLRFWMVLSPSLRDTFIFYAHHLIPHPLLSQVDMDMESFFPVYMRWGWKWCIKRKINLTMRFKKQEGGVGKEKNWEEAETTINTTMGIREIRTVLRKEVS